MTTVEIIAASTVMMTQKYPTQDKENDRRQMMKDKIILSCSATIPVDDYDHDEKK